MFSGIPLENRNPLELFRDLLLDAILQPTEEENIEEDRGTSNAINRFQKNETISLKFSLLEVINTVLPYSSSVRQFNQIINNITANKAANLPISNGSDLIKIVALLSEILELHWDDFSLGTKVLILEKICLLENRSKLILEFIYALLRRLLNISTWKQILIFWRTDTSNRTRISQQLTEEFNLLINKFNILQSTVENIFKKDGYLLKENKKKINEFISALREYQKLINHESEHLGIIKISEEDYQALMEPSENSGTNKELIADIKWYRDVMNKKGNFSVKP
jgi:hypothetical protein